MGFLGSIGTVISSTFDAIRDMKIAQEMDLPHDYGKRLRLPLGIDT